MRSLVRLNLRLGLNDLHIKMEMRKIFRTTRQSRRATHPFSRNSNKSFNTQKVLEVTLHRLQVREGERVYDEVKYLVKPVMHAVSRYREHSLLSSDSRSAWCTTY